MRFSKTGALPLFPVLRLRLALLLPLLFLASTLQAQPRHSSSCKVLQDLQKLHTTGAVLYIAAHPDDENTRLLAWLANERHLRTGYLSLTRGDGGQNLIGKEQGAMLGLLRTQELLAARRTDGAEQFFTRAYDFGYSKSPDETLSIWDHDSVLADVVWTIRKFRPDIIICRFPTTGEGGHGHHTASAILAQEAFTAAADPKRFPNQLAWVSTWQARRLFWNTFKFGSVNTTSPDQLHVDVGGFNPLMGESYGTIAAESRSNHKSQGFGTAPSRGEAIEYFKQILGDSAKKDLLEGINTSWTRMSAAAGLATLTQAAIQHFNPLKPQASVPEIVKIYKAIAALPESNPSLKYWKQQKLKEAQALLVEASGLWLEAAATDFIAVPGKAISYRAEVISRSMPGIRLNRIIWISDGDSQTALPLAKDIFYSFQHRQTLDAHTPFSNPYWLNKPHTAGMYIVDDPLMIGKPENDFGPRVIFDLNIGGVNLQVPRAVVYKSTDPVKGEVYRPLEILPPVSIALSDPLLVCRDSTPHTLHITVTANTADVSGKIVLPTVPDWDIQLGDPSFHLMKTGDEATIEASIRRQPASREASLLVSARTDEGIFSKSIHRFQYDHVPYQFMLSDARVTLVPVSLQMRGRNIGYIPGAGDEIPECLRRIGYKVSILSNEQLAAGKLSGFDAIVAGIRAYNVNESLPHYHEQLMHYIRQGGNLIVQYNTNSRLGPMKAQPGPYPFTISSKRVTDERAKVSFVHPEQAVLNEPNKITPQDFDNWIQERGTYFATDLDKHYQTVLSMHDKGEAAQEGSLIIAPYGKGNFVYTGLVFFRQLPAGNPGAYRLFVNLLSLPKNQSVDAKD